MKAGCVWLTGALPAVRVVEPKGEDSGDPGLAASSSADLIWRSPSMGTCKRQSFTLKPRSLSRTKVEEARKEALHKTARL